MERKQEEKKMFKSEKEAAVLKTVYGEENVEKQQKRYEHLLEGFEKNFGEGQVDFFTSPGRTEILGNHTDHNHGKVLTGSIAMDTIAAARKNGTSVVHVISEGYAPITIDLEHLDSKCKCKGTLSLLIGMFEAALKKGYKVEGFDAYIITDVIGAAGVSSSASFEMLICAIFDYFSNENKIGYVEYAKIGQYAEHEYWLKQSGLLDQMACAVGGVISIDFKEDMPKVEKLDFGYDQLGYDLIIVNTGKGHADLSAEYSAVPNEMKKVAEYFGKEVLEQVDEDAVIENVKAIRKFAGDRAVLRAFHFFEENKRVDAEVEALESKDFDTFLRKVTESGDSSWKWLQNCYCNETPDEQSITVALALTKLYLDKIGHGVCRVHGGGFAGVIAAFLPKEYTEGFTAYIDKALGAGSAYVMHIRPQGAVKVEL